MWTVLQNTVILLHLGQCGTAQDMTPQKMSFLHWKYLQCGCPGQPGHTHVGALENILSAYAKDGKHWIHT